jgi:hypothetical protein
MLLHNDGAFLVIPEKQHEEGEDDERSDDAAGDREPRHERLHYQRGWSGRRCATR